MRRLTAGLLVGLVVFMSGALGVLPTASAKDHGAEEAVWTVQAIIVEGNRAVDAQTILDAVQETQVGEPLDRARVEKDLVNVFNLGYFDDVEANAHEVPGGVQVVFTVYEYPVVRTINVRGDVVPAQMVKGWMQTQEGRILNRNVMQADLDVIHENVLEHYDIWVRPETDFRGGVLTLVLHPLRVGSIRIEGNAKTRDFVIWRELTFKPGDVLNRAELRRSLRRVLMLGFFEEVKPQFLTTDRPDEIDVVVEVEERKTGTASLGAGYSSQDGFIGYIEVADKNFLGRGQQANVRWEFGRSKSTYDVGFFEPYLRGTPTSFGFNVYNRTFQRERIDNNTSVFYEEHRAGGDVTVGRPLNDFTRGSVTYKLENTRLTPRDPGTMDPEDGSTRSLTFATRTDTTDHPFNPTTGHRNRLSAELAGSFLGGDYHFTKYQGEYSRYLPAGAGGQVWAFRAMYGLVTGENVPLHEQFHVGGPETVRGYRYGAFRGHEMVVLNAEYRFKLADVVQGVVFADAGRARRAEDPVRLSDLKFGFGVGLRLHTPLGIMRIDYGIGEEGGRTYFSLGPSF